VSIPRPRRIPEATVVRLPIYERLLREMQRGGATTVSSEQLAAMARVNAAKVRKDLSLLGSFGTRGTGYDTAYLIEQIDTALGIDQDWPLAIAGIGNLGRALANYRGFSTRGFRVAALFDVNPDVIGQSIGAVEVRHIDDLPTVAAGGALAIGVVTTPTSVAQLVTDRMVAAGVRSILNFAPVVLEVPCVVHLRYVDLSIELQVMSFYQSNEVIPDAGDGEGDGERLAGTMRSMWSVGISQPGDGAIDARSHERHAVDHVEGPLDWRTP
jgi:redox-sensing transcriptional repressor